ncbi:MAG: hypothetical protein NC307_10730 [Roseburia sp.]|nr:hypothetical protein [Roseburia sp.]
MTSKKVSKKQLAVFGVAVIVFTIVAWIGAQSRAKKMGKVIYAENLDEVIATVDQIPITLKDFGIYAVHEETLVQQQARVYDDDTKKYWNAHTNGGFLKLTARDAAIDLLIHDAIFYRMAEETGIYLDENEREYLANEQMDFWNDLEEEQREKLAMSKEEVEDAFLKMALAQKMQQQYALERGADNSEYEAAGQAYQEMLADHEVEKNEEFIDRIDFGNIILEH